MYASVLQAVDQFRKQSLSASGYQHYGAGTTGHSEEGQAAGPPRTPFRAGRAPISDQ